MLRLGNMSAALNRNPRAFFDWLVKLTPEGGCINETLVSIALDAWHESTKEETS